MVCVVPVVGTGRAFLSGTGVVAGFSPFLGIQGRRRNFRTQLNFQTGLNFRTLFRVTAEIGGSCLFTTGHAVRSLGYSNTQQSVAVSLTGNLRKHPGLMPAGSLRFPNVRPKPLCLLTPRANHHEKPAENPVPDRRPGPCHHRFGLLRDVHLFPQGRSTLPDLSTGL